MHPSDRCKHVFSLGGAIIRNSRFALNIHEATYILTVGVRSPGGLVPPTIELNVSLDSRSGINNSLVLVEP